MAMSWIRKLLSRTTRKPVSSGRRLSMEELESRLVPTVTAVPDYYILGGYFPGANAAAGVLSNDVSSTGAPLQAQLVSGPSHGSLTLNPDGSFTYAADPNYSGNDSFTYQATDGVSDSTVTTVTLEHNPMPTGSSYTGNENSPLYIQLQKPNIPGADTFHWFIVIPTLAGQLYQVDSDNVTLGQPLNTYSQLVGGQPLNAATEVTNANGWICYVPTTNAATATPSTVSIICSPIRPIRPTPLPRPSSASRK